MTSLRTPPPVDGTWPDLHDAIHRACHGNALPRLRELLTDGANVLETAQTHSARDMTVLHTAAESSVEIIDLLMAHGGNEVLENKCGPGEEGRWAGYTALQMAAKTGRRDIAMRLLEHGAHYDAFSAAALGDTDHLSTLLQKEKNALMSTDDYQATLLHWSVALDQRKMVEFLIEHGAEIDAHDIFNETPLLLAAVRQSAQQEVMQFSRERRLTVSFDSLVGLLLNNGASIDVFAAAALGDTTRLNEILNNHDTLAISTNTHGTSPLHWSARTGQIDSARLLLERGANINAKDSIGCTPLWYAAYWGHNTEMTYFLCKNGADVSLRNIWNKDITAYDCGYGCASIIRSFRD